MALDTSPKAKAKQRSPRPAAAADKFTYALAQWTAERREKGWFVGRTLPSWADRKPDWSGPYQTIETACLAIARRHAVELADRHTRSIEAHGLKCGHPLHGLKPTTRLR